MIAQRERGLTRKGLFTESVDTRHLRRAAEQTQCTLIDICKKPTKNQTKDINQRTQQDTTRIDNALNFQASTSGSERPRGVEDRERGVCLAGRQPRIRGQCPQGRSVRNRLES